ncbi:hypothetical protein GCM10023346_45830 [Arthrobacter gyeryongensis]|uniref:Flp pilus assembly protein TadG n=1 Tax=Arthrobacter gyeryongensis TaxID=1650592 RepID=A0ABP9SVF8_9MICC
MLQLLVDPGSEALSRFQEVICRPPAEGQESTVPPRASERGSAVVEFILLSLLLMVPVVYFIVTIGQIQGGSFAVVGAADQAAKVFVMQEDASQARAAAERTALLTLADYGHPAERAFVDVVCDRGDCLTAGAAVTVTVKLTVPLPMLPFGDTLNLDAANLSASATQIVGRFR